MKKIGFDIDGTILTNNNKYDLIRRIYPNFDENKHYTVYPLMKSLREHGFVKEGFSNEEFYNEHEEVRLGQGDFYKEFKELYFLLKKKGYEIYFVTARLECEAAYTKQLFEYNGIPYENVHYVGSFNKLNIIKELELDYYFEDNTSIIENLVKSDEIETILGFIEAPYNKDFFMDNKRLIMFRYWTNVLSYFK